MKIKPALKSAIVFRTGGGGKPQPGRQTNLQRGNQHVNFGGRWGFHKRVNTEPDTISDQAHALEQSGCMKKGVSGTDLRV